MTSRLTSEAAAQLQEGVNLLLNRWAALRMAVENEWGGRDSLQKSQQLAHELFCRFTQTNEKVYIDDIEELLVEFMLYMNTEIDDGSIEEIAEKLMFMHEECLEGNFNSIKRLKETNAPSVSYAREPGENDSDDDDGDDEHHLREEIFSEMEVEVSQDQPTPNQEHTMSVEPIPKEVPEAVVDGWTVVSSRRDKSRRN